MADAGDERGRAAQRRRTRRAIVQAAMDLLARGETPTVADVAAAADVSRRTVYMYFPTLEQLLIDATLGALSEAEVERVLEPSDTHGGDVAARVDGLVRTIQRMSPEVERLGRTLVRLTVEAPGPPGDPGARRGHRRVRWIEEALAPLRGEVDERRLRRLVWALAMVAGWEALIVQRDVLGLTAAEGEELSAWAAGALLDATLGEVRAPAAAPEAPRI
jgi:AcrR family transcriptional regulator